MLVDLAKQYAEGKIPTVLAVILINIFLLIALWSRLDTFEAGIEIRLRSLEDFKLVIEARNGSSAKVNN